MKRTMALKGNTLALVLILIGLLAVSLVASLAFEANFFSPGNLKSLSRGFSLLGIATIGQAQVIISGGLDLSVGSVISTTNVMAANITDGRDDLMIPMLLAAVGLGVIVGLANGLMVTKRHVPPFIATLGVSIMLNGLRLMVTQGIPSGQIPDALVGIGTRTSLGIPNLLYIFVFVAVTFYLILHRSTYGRRLYATGVNKAAATYCGVRSDRVIILAYIASSVCAALVGVLLGGYIQMADQKIGEGYDLDTISAAVLGGAAIGGGAGSVPGTIAGVLIMLMVTNLMLLLHFPQQSQMLIKGLIVIGALWLNGRLHRK